jgi:Ran GTPase-activating protein (RanGAP) involved in mRNA processing and transport
MNEQELIKLTDILNDNSKSLVGILLKRLENLNISNTQSLSFLQIKEIYVNLVKDSIYENNRFLLKLIKANFESGKIIFNQKPKE